jgi:hypothetical protein
VLPLEERHRSKVSHWSVFWEVCLFLRLFTCYRNKSEIYRWFTKTLQRTNFHPISCNQFSKQTSAWCNVFVPSQCQSSSTGPSCPIADCHVHKSCCPVPTLCSWSAALIPTLSPGCKKATVGPAPSPPPAYLIHPLPPFKKLHWIWLISI